LDCLLALAIGCGRKGWVQPKMSHENVIRIKGGRHPLQELVVPSYIANDCHMSGGNGDAESPDPIQLSSSSRPESSGFPSTIIMTGPNHSGKSVYLKQVALIVYLAHIGCFVPAERAVIGLTDRILTRIATRESVARNESAFAIDLRQAAFAMNFATRRSLVLLDEFGKGTNSQDGAGLVTAVLQHFAGLGVDRPKVLAATHFHEIFESRFLEEGPEFAFQHMDIRLDFDTSVTEDQLTYLYQLRPGRSVSSFGTQCAAMNGVDEAVVERAEAIVLLLARNEDLEASCARLSTAEVHKLQVAEAVARGFLSEQIAPPPPTTPPPLVKMGSRAKNASEDWYRKMLERILATGDAVMSDAV
jgi:DNA mismatch repair protein MSH5